MHNKTLTISGRIGDFHASFAGNEGLWGADKDPVVAIGSCLKNAHSVSELTNFCLPERLLRRDPDTKVISPSEREIGLAAIGGELDLHFEFPIIERHLATLKERASTEKWNNGLPADKEATYSPDSDVLTLLIERNSKMGTRMHTDELAYDFSTATFTKSQRTIFSGASSSVRELNDAEINAAILSFLDPIDFFRSRGG